MSDINVKFHSVKHIMVGIVRSKIIDLCATNGGPRVPKGRHLGRPNGIEIHSKMNLKFKSEKIASWSQLGPIFGRFGSREGERKVSFPVFFEMIA